MASSREGLKKQRKAILEYAKKNNFSIKEYWEYGGVGGNANHHERGIDKIFQRLKAGDVLIVADYSRLSRNTEDLVAIILELTKRQIEIIAVDMW